MPDTGQVTYDAKSFIIGGRRVFVCSGAVHYFRSPRESWKDIITKAKLGGLNTIETYVAWNFHECEERKYDFEGDRDLGEFLETIHDQGMYAIVRPGPYICAEWDFGGFPWWLATKEGIRFRAYNKTFLKYVDRWFDQLIPLIAKYQYTNGGPVIAVQVENEYSYAGQKSEMAEKYQGYLRDGMLARGIDVPLLTCAGGCSGTIECANAHKPSELFPELRKRQPDMPLFSTEFWAAWYDTWGQEHRTRDARDLYNETLRIAAAGGSGYIYYMWHGGTNFGYTTSYLQTTSYDIDAPLSEAAQFTEKGCWTKLASQFLRTVAPILTEADGPAELGQPLPEGVKAWVRRASDSAVIFFENTGTDSVTFGFEWESSAIPNMTLRPGEMRAVTIGLGVGADIVLAYSTAMPFAIVTQEERPFIFVHGTSGTREYLAIFDGVRETRVSVRFAESHPVAHETKSVTVIAMDEKLALRTWFPFGDEGVIVGPELSQDVTEPFHLWTIAHGTVRRIDSPGETPPAELPELSDWQCAPGSPEARTDFDDSGWQIIDAPKSMLHLGNGSEAYGWYRAEFESNTAKRTKITFQECADILMLFVNGKFIGVSPAPPEDRKPPWSAEFQVSFERGRNVIAVLANNLGLAKGHWQIGKPHEQEAKGIFAPVTLSDGSDIRGWKFMGRLNGERLGWTEPSSEDAPWQVSRPYGVEWRLTWWKTSFELPATRSRPVFLDMSSMTKGVIWLNGRNLGRYWNAGPQRYYYAPAAYLARENTLVIVDEGGASPEGIKLIYDESALPYR